MTEGSEKSDGPRRIQSMTRPRRSPRPEHCAQGVRHFGVDRESRPRKKETHGAADRNAAVAEIVDEFNASAGAVLTEYRGLTVKELQTLRRSLGANANYAVVKNTLTKIAAEQAGFNGLDDYLAGPTAVAFIKGDVVEVAKGLRDFAKANPALVIKGGFLDGKALDAKEVGKLADLESREVLLAKLAGAMQASLAQALYVFNALPTKVRSSLPPCRSRRPKTPRSSQVVPVLRLPPRRLQPSCC